VALYLLRQPLWLLGWVAALGVLSSMRYRCTTASWRSFQPLLVTELVFALVLRRVWIRQDVPAAAWASAGTICVALAVFLVMAAPPRRPFDGRREAWLSVISSSADRGRVSLVAREDHPCAGRRSLRSRLH